MTTEAREYDKQHIKNLYHGCRAYHGELHDHANTGGTSDGACMLAKWRDTLDLLKMDFAAILDHRQVRHMYLPDWEDGLFIGGTEPGTFITDSKAESNEMHYNMIFSEPKELEKLLEDFTEYEFTGGSEGHFVYPNFTCARFCELIDAVKAHGGFFVQPHPTQLMRSDDPCDFWFRDEIGFEIFYRDMANKETAANYALWMDLLALGKRVWACAGGDLHKEATDTALTTLYAEEHANKSYLQHLRTGDFTCGPVGIRMAVGGTKTGGHCCFAGQRLVLCVGDFHDSVLDTTHTYRVDLLNNNGIVFSKIVPCDQTSFFAINIQGCDFYRAEVWDITRKLRIAIGNPIWNM
ncbi:MAG: hypothetical protein SCM11_01470 [Bacillota bacterium]|nr:hypothetical protein [Bacillota bacterium]